MSEIRVTRGAGRNWNAKFGPGAQNPVDPQTSVLSSVDAVLKSVGPLSPPASATPMAFTEISLNNVMTGDVLRYDNNKWRNYNEKNLTDGGNF